VLPVLLLLVQGVSHHALAAQAYTTADTVKSYVVNILTRRQAENRTRAADIACRYGLV
jgi:DNA-binding NarL/FixJ family response regulator